MSQYNYVLSYESTTRFGSNITAAAGRAGDRVTGPAATALATITALLSSRGPCAIVVVHTRLSLFQRLCPLAVAGPLLRARLRRCAAPQTQPLLQCRGRRRKVAAAIDTSP